MTEEVVRLGATAKQLLDQVNQIFPGEVMVRFGKEKAGYLLHGQATRDAMGPRFLIEISDVTAPDYTATHELMHMLMSMSGFPQIMFNVSFGDEQLDEQLMIMATSLYNAVAHNIVVAEQRKHGLITPEVADAFAEGIAQTLTLEGAENDDEAALRLLTLVDALAFYADDEDKKKYTARFRKDYPIAYVAAKELFAEVTKKPVDSPFAMRRAVVKMFKGFDAQMKAWGMPELHSSEFATLSSVFSQRQLRMQVRQVFEVFHSEMKDKNTGERAFVGLNRNDHQNAFVIAVPEDVTKGSTEWFKQLYDMTVEELFDSIAMPYSMRDTEPTAEEEK
jgi:hypothetical protein